MKCGTSAVHYYLDLHPDVSMSRPKELNFFVGELVREGPFWSMDPQRLRRRRRNTARGLDWYRGHFSARAAVRGESSPSYTSPWSPDSAARIAAIVPEARLVFMVRDPIERAISHYLFQRARGHERRDMAECLRDRRDHYVARGMYHALLERYLDHFPPASILVVAQEDLLRRRRATMRTIYRFAGVDDSFWSPKFERERNRSRGEGGRYGLVRRLEKGSLARLAYRLPDEAKWRVERVLSPPRRPVDDRRPELSAAVREQMIEYMQDDVTRLRAFAGKDFSEWSL